MAIGRRWPVALALQRTLVSAPSGRSRDDLRDRFRLLRWEMATACWREALETAEGICARLACRGLLSGMAAGWVFLARAVAHLQLGAGAKYRKAMASVLRFSRRRPDSALHRTALRFVAACSRNARGSDGAPRFLQRRRARLAVHIDRAGVPPATSEAARAEDEETLAGFLRGWRACAGGGPGSFRWRHLPDLIEGPPEARRLAAALDAPANDWASAGVAEAAPRSSHAALRGSDAPLRGSDAADPDPAPGHRLLESWIRRAEEEPDLDVPVWLAPLLARIAEERVPETDAASRLKIHQALSRLAGQVAEPWARALVLASLAESTLWIADQAGAPAEAVRSLARARADLGLAVGLFRRLGWEERAVTCEQRWARLAMPSLGAVVAETACAPAPAWNAHRRSSAWLRQTLADAGFLTADPRSLREIAPLILLAPSPLPVLILGESGTGKEVAARALHRWSRLRGELVAIHCGAIPRDLLESELFGHTRGAFTGANSEKQGLVEVADGGSLFLDEIGEMGMEAQMKMLRVLESGEVRRLGDLRPRKARIRLIAATHRDLEEAVRSGAFRLDLYHRIRGVVVRLRPLRERRGDIPLLAAHFLTGAVGDGPALRLEEAALAALLAHDWPGNVRELRGVLLRAAHLARALDQVEITRSLVGLPAPARPSSEDTTDLSGSAAAQPWIGELPPKEALARAGLESVLEEMERRLILGALEECGWNRTHAARSLGGISRTTLISKMKRLGIGGSREKEIAG